MRDPKRIDRILGEVKTLWNIYPDQRLSQLLQNYVFGRGDFFYLEDDETERLLRLEIIKRGGELSEYGKNILKIVNKSPNPFPAYATEGDSGFDIRAWIVDFEPTGDANTITLEPRDVKMIHTGLYMEIPKGFEVQIRPRSGLALRNGIGVLNSPGTIDVSYRGEVCVILTNHSYEPFKIRNGDRIAQGVLCPVSGESFTKLVPIDSLSEDTQRGAGGFGHTGKN